MKSEGLSDLVKVENREIIDPFPPAKELFALANNSFSGRRELLTYTDPDYKDENAETPDLPEKFHAFTAGHPGKYYLVAYENRLGAYYKEGTRMQELLLSTSRHRYDSNKLLREIQIRQHDPSDAKGNVIFLKASERVNESHYQVLNTARGEELDFPHGERAIEYEIDASGNKKVIQVDYRRLDEGLFQWRGKNSPVRWLRNLQIKYLSEEKSEIVYGDSYLIDRDERGVTREEARIKIKILRNGTEKKVFIDIGSALGEGRVLFEDVPSNVRIVLHSPGGAKAYENQEEIIKQDPNYAFLFDNVVDVEQVLELVESRVSMLEKDWDKPQSVFSAQIRNSDIKTIE